MTTNDDEIDRLRRINLLLRGTLETCLQMLAGWDNPTGMPVQESVQRILDSLLKEELEWQSMGQLERIAHEHHDGHVTIMRFTTNWRVGFGTPSDRFDIQAMPVGKSFEEAALAAMERADDRTAEMGEDDWVGA